MSTTTAPADPYAPWRDRDPATFTLAEQSTLRRLLLADSRVPQEVRDRMAPIEELYQLIRTIHP